MIHSIQQSDLQLIVTSSSSYGLGDFILWAYVYVTGIKWHEAKCKKSLWIFSPAEDEKLHRLFVSSQGTGRTNCIMKQYSLAVLIITYSWIDVNCTNCAMMRHWGSAIMVVSKEWNKDAHQWSLVGFIFFLQVFIVLAALLFEGAGYEIYIFLKTQIGQKTLAYYHQNNSR